MPENINRKKEEVISRETAGKIPWKYLTIILAGILLLGAIWMVANSFVTQTPAKTSTDLMNILSKSGGDKAPPAVNGTPTPSPTEEIYDQNGRKAYVVSTVSDVPIGKKEHFIKKGMFEIEMTIYQESLDYNILKLEIPPQDQRFGLRVKLYDKDGIVYFNGAGDNPVDYYADIFFLTDGRISKAYFPNKAIKPGVRNVIRAEILVFIQDLPKATLKSTPRIIQ